MRTALAAAGLLLALSLAAESLAAPAGTAGSSPNASVTRKKVKPIKPSWEQCFAMSVDRGFNHDIEEWWQSIQDCQDGKIPL
jgi:hypothetical protein